MSRSTLPDVVSLVATLTLLGPSPGGAQEQARTDSVASQEQGEDVTDHTLKGALVGIASGFALGLGIANATDYALKEGGLFVVAIVGGGLGGFIGGKVGSALGRPWEDPAPFQVSVRYAYTTLAGAEAIEAAFAEAGFPGMNEHHPIAPSLTATYGLGPVTAGLELSGLSGQWFLGRQPGAVMAESLGGWSSGILATYSPTPTKSRRWTYSLGGGADYYDVSVLTFIDLQPGLYPMEQPNRSSSVTHNMLGGHLRAGIEIYLVPDVSVQLNGVAKFAGTVDVPGVSVVHTRPELNRTQPAHSIDMSSFHLQIGMGLRF